MEGSIKSFLKAEWKVRDTFYGSQASSKALCIQFSW
jgi:hypothetical protein